MNIEDVFGTPVVRIKCNNEEFWKNELLVSSVEESYRTTNTPMQSNDVDSRVGKCYTTVNRWFQLVDLPGADNLVDWVRQAFLQAKNVIGPAHKGNNIVFRRSWSNQMVYGDYGFCHIHKGLEQFKINGEIVSPDAVGIFYVDVPPGSSNLVFIKNGKTMTGVDDYPQDQQYWLHPIEGELVIHTSDIWHAVSRHNSELPRNVFVFDINYV